MMDKPLLGEKVDTYTRTCIHTHTYIHTYMHTYIHTYIHTYTHTYIHTYVHTYVHTYIRTYLHVQVSPFPASGWSVFSPKCCTAWSVFHYCYIAITRDAVLLNFLTARHLPRGVALHERASHFNYIILFPSIICF